MDLFGQHQNNNILPYDGEVNYYGRVFPPQEASQYLDALLHNIAWKNDEAFIYGKHYITKRQAAWYGDDNYEYTYSGTTKQALIWTDDLLVLKKLVEQYSGGTIFNSCLLNLYHNGTEGMAWHSDDESSLGRNTVIASLSLGADRKFSFKHKVSKYTTSINLENGSLLVMKGTTQTHWLHSVPKTTRVSMPRVNLTFRTIVG